MSGALLRWQREAHPLVRWAGLRYVIPALVILWLFEVWPIFYNVWISLWRWDIGPVRFIGLDNYMRLFGEGFITRNDNDQLAVGEVAHS